MQSTLAITHGGATYGIAYDALDDTLWSSSLGILYQYDKLGNFLALTNLGGQLQFNAFGMGLVANRNKKKRSETI